MVQWLGLCAFIAKGVGLIPGWYGPKKKKKERKKERKKNDEYQFKQ